MPWYLEFYLLNAAVFGAMALIGLLIGIGSIAINGREGWGDIHEPILVILLFAVLWPVALVALPFIAIYRAVCDK